LATILKASILARKCGKKTNNLLKYFHFSASSKSEMSIFLKMGFIHHKKKHKIFDGKLVLGLNPSPFTYYGNRIIFFNGLILV